MVQYSQLWELHHFFLEGNRYSLHTQLIILRPFEDWRLKIENWKLKIQNYSDKKWLVIFCDIEMESGENGLKREKKRVFHRNIVCYERNYMSYDRNYICYGCYLYMLWRAKKWVFWGKNLYFSVVINSQKITITWFSVHY